MCVCEREVERGDREVRESERASERASERERERERAAPVPIHQLIARRVGSQPTRLFCVCCIPIEPKLRRHLLSVAANRDVSKTRPTAFFFIFFALFLREAMK